MQNSTYRDGDNQFDNSHALVIDGTKRRSLHLGQSKPDDAIQCEGGANTVCSK
jgi:hypothetical protein